MQTDADNGADRADGEGPRPGKLLRVLDAHPLIRLVIQLAGVLAPVIAVQLAFGSAGSAGGWTGALGRVAATASTVVVGVASYVALVRVLERRRVSELSLRGAAVEAALGVACGCALFSAVIGVLWGLGFYSVVSPGTWAVAGWMLGISVTSGVVEEIVFRGIVFRNLEDLLGTWIALALSAATFGLIHISNPHSSAWAAAAIAIEAGILLGAGFVLTRRLWLVMGLHFGWNFTQGGIFGVPVSGGGGGLGGLLVGSLSGPPLLSGGDFGAEASVFAVAICLAAGIAFAWRAKAAGQFLAPRWRRRKPRW